LNSWLSIVCEADTKIEDFELHPCWKTAKMISNFDYSRK
jgi:hypothetical protein